jgi:hypothetical protein
MLGVVSVLVLISCDGGPTAPAVAVARVDVAGAPAENVLLVGGTVQLTAAARDAGGRVLERRVDWASSDPAIAQVSPAGLVTAVASGVVVITAESGGQTGAVGLAVRVAVPVPPAGAPSPVTTQLLGGSLSLTLPPGAATVSTLTVGRALVLTDDPRILTATAFAIGPTGLTFAAPVTAEVSLNLAAIPAAKRAGVRLFRVTPDGDIEGIAASAVDQGRGVLVAPLTRAGTYVAIVPGDPAQLLLPDGASRRVEVGTAVPGITVVAIDAVGNPVPGASIEFSVEGALGSIVGDTIALTDIAGRAELPGEWIAGPAKGNYALRARVLGTPLSAQFTATAFAPAVAVQISSAPASGRSGVLFTEPIIVELVDAEGDRAEETQPVTLSLLGAGGTLVGTTQETAVNGGAIFQGQRIDGPGSFRLIVNSAGLLPDTTDAIEITQAVARVEILTQPAGALSGVPFTTQPAVELRDDAGIRVIGGDAVVTVFAQGPGILFGTRSVTAVDGVATFTDLAVEGVGALALNFTSGGAVNVLSNEIVVGPAPPGIRLLVGATPIRDAIPNQLFAASLSFDLANRAGADLAALDVTMTWDPARFEFFDWTTGPWADSTNTQAVIAVDASEVAAGVIRFTGNTPNATVNGFMLGQVLLRTLATEVTVESVVNATVHTATSGAGAPVTVRVLPMTVTVYAP